MYRRISLSFVLAIALFTAATLAVPIQVENFSFELPNTGKQAGFDKVPGWSTDSVTSGSGIETGAEPTDGDWTAFLMGTDPSIWQLTDHTIVPGDVFELKAHASDAGGSTSLFMSLYYDDNDTRITVASINADISDEMQECSLVFDSADAPDSAGHLLGIELANTLAGAGDWLSLDNIRLDLIQAGKPILASQPGPENEQIDVPVDTILSWTAGKFADKHDVYFSTNFDEVVGNTALVSPGQNANSYEPGRLEFGTTYYWRVDEVNAPPDNTVYKGEVWSFTVESLAMPVPGERITATASSQSPGQGPENTINESGLVNELHSTQTKDMWATAESETLPTWIQYEFDNPYKLHEMLVWNYNGTSFLAAVGLQDVTVEYSTDGIDWILNDSVSVFNQATGKNDYAANNIVPFGDVPVKYVKITASTNWSGNFLEQYGLSEVRFMQIPVSARLPNPDNGAGGVDINVTLGWRAGREADEHNIYISADEQAVIGGTVSPVTAAETGYGPLSLDLGTTYYWRVDEVNNANTTPLWQGDVWSFTTSEYRVVDDFESYNDIPMVEEGSNLIYLTWIDGYDNPSTNGSTIGYTSGASLETVTVRSGHAAPLMYNNTTAGVSKVTANAGVLPGNSDWTVGSPEQLVLWIYGNANNNSSIDRMYVEVDGVKRIFGGDITAEEWQDFSIDLASLGVNLSNVGTVTIGLEKIGSTGGSGMVFIDDIRLYRSL